MTLLERKRRREKARSFQSGVKHRSSAKSKHRWEVISINLNNNHWRNGNARRNWHYDEKQEVDLIEVDRTTERAIEVEVEDLIQEKKRPCSLMEVAGVLAGSQRVLQSYAGTTERSGGGILKAVKGLFTRRNKDLRSRMKTRREQMLRCYRIMNAFNSLQRSLSANQIFIASWLEARDILSSHFDFPAQPHGGAVLSSSLISFYRNDTMIADLRPSHTKWPAIVVPITPSKQAEEIQEQKQQQTEELARQKQLEEEDRLAEQERLAEENYMVEEQRRAAEEKRPVEQEREEEARRLASSLLRVFTKDEEALIEEEIFGEGQEDEILHSIGPDSVQRGSMKRLKPRTYLNDEVIHYFLVMLSKRDEELCKLDPNRKPSHFFKSFFMTKLLNEGHTDAEKNGEYEYKNVKRWSKKAPGGDLFGLDKIFFPINQGNAHWICAVVFMKEKRIQMYDSLGGEGMEYLECIFRYLQDEHLDKKKCPLPDHDQWRLVPCTLDTPHQANGNADISCFAMCCAGCWPPRV